jgi:hypothetical protein
VKIIDKIKKGNYDKYTQGDKFMENIDLKELKKDDINKNILENFHCCPV